MSSSGHGLAPCVQLSPPEVGHANCGRGATFHFTLLSAKEDAQEPVIET
jgi:hypothetical protein